MVTSAMTGCSTATTNTTESTEEADLQEEVRELLAPMEEQ